MFDMAVNMLDMLGLDRICVHLGIFRQRSDIFRHISNTVQILLKQYSEPWYTENLVKHAK